jgi:hypothetical protein
MTVESSMLALVNFRPSISATHPKYWAVWPLENVTGVPYEVGVTVAADAVAVPDTESLPEAELELVAELVAEAEAAELSVALGDAELAIEL